MGLTEVLLTCATGPMPTWVSTLLGPARRGIANLFARRYRGPELAEHVARAAELKTLDPNVSPGEVEACRRRAARSRAN